ncbi:MAG: DUF3823 domain-containing protein, partial [Chitinophagaceae bacterium]
SIYTLCAVSVFVFAGCEKDNLKQPESTLTGKVIYQGQPIGVRSLGVQFEIWQSGYQLFSKIPLNIAQDGTFSAVLFGGDYKLVRSVGAGPWADNTDTINVSLRGSTAVDIPVEPYSIIKNVSYERTGSSVKATFTIERNTTTRTLELARLYIGPNLILDQNNNAANVQVLASAITIGTPVSVTVNIPASIANDNFIFARVGVKTTGVAELLYTMPEKIQLR